MVTETAEIYRKHVQPYMQQKRDEGRLNWVFNIIEGRTEQDDVFYREHGEEGFLVLPDLNWDRKTITSLHLLGLVERRDIWSVRDLQRRNKTWLERMRERLLDATVKLYQELEKNQLKLYVHYQPTYYHFHIHIVHVALEGGATQSTGKALGLENIISQLETMSGGEESGMADIRVPSFRSVHEGGELIARHVKEKHMRFRTRFSSVAQGSSHFDKLPLELKLEIAKHVLVSDKPIIDMKAHGTALSILRVSQQLHEGAKPIFYRENTFHFNDLGMLERSLRPLFGKQTGERHQASSCRAVMSPTIPYLSQHLRHLSLDVIIAESRKIAPEDWSETNYRLGHYPYDVERGSFSVYYGVDHRYKPWEITSVASIRKEWYRLIGRILGRLPQLRTLVLELRGTRLWYRSPALMRRGAVNAVRLGLSPYPSKLQSQCDFITAGIPISALILSAAYDNAMPCLEKITFMARSDERYIHVPLIDDTPEVAFWSAPQSALVFERAAEDWRRLTLRLSNDPPKSSKHHNDL
ncbi:hypothetical protein B0A49_07265 [Cryomyces minteri]|uniref:HIT domain-containing protein n=1 Tax=Cryomyces minteri TaxID=331657 RepID=A0A4U0X187_9PEZI|nr:hypothetical protein B0A49_07265 [Cryomyces minteri]